MASEKSALGVTEPLRLSVPMETGKESDEAALDLAFNRHLDRGQDVALWLQPFGEQCAVRPSSKVSVALIPSLTADKALAQRLGMPPLPESQGDSVAGGCEDMPSAC